MLIPKHSLHFSDCLFSLWCPAAEMAFSSISLTGHPMCPPRYNWSVNSAMEPSLMTPYPPDRSDLSLFWTCNPWSLFALWCGNCRKSGTCLIHICVPYISFLGACRKVVLNKYSLKCIGWRYSKSCSAASVHNWLFTYYKFFRRVSRVVINIIVLDQSFYTKCTYWKIHLFFHFSSLNSFSW